jgi:phosphate transport system substrate-binding protein
MLYNPLILNIISLLYARRVLGVSARDYINIVYSRTVYPIISMAAETFGKSTCFKTPKN